MVGAVVGFFVAGGAGFPVGARVGFFVGGRVGFFVGVGVGFVVGDGVSVFVGVGVGFLVGAGVVFVAEGVGFRDAVGAGTRGLDTLGDGILLGVCVCVTLGVMLIPGEFGLFEVATAMISTRKQRLIKPARTPTNDFWTPVRL